MKEDKKLRRAEGKAIICIPPSLPTSILSVIFCCEKGARWLTRD